MNGEAPTAPSWTSGTVSGPAPATPAPRRALIWAARAAFALTCAGVFVLALLPPGEGALLPWDKANHVLAFYVLAVMGAAAFPRLGPPWLAAALFGFGVSIELVQALPMVGRDAEAADALADGVGVLFALAPLALARWRARFRSRP